MRLRVLRMILLASCLFPAASHAQSGSLTMAPDFEAVDLEGRPVRLSDLRGQIVLLDFWAVWCRPCHAETPYLAAAYRKYADQGLVILSISLDRDRAAVRRYLEEHPKVQWRQILNQDNDGRLTRLYGVNSIPRHFLIDRDGALLGSSSAFRGRALAPSVRAALRGKLQPEPWAGLSPTQFKQWRGELGAVDRGLPGPLVGIEISPSVAFLESGEARSFAVHGVDPQGRRLPAPEAVRWTAADGGVVTDSSLFTSGTETGLFANSVTATVERDGKVMEATASVLVRRRPATPAAPLRVAFERAPIRRFNLPRQGSCCVLRDFTAKPPSVVVAAPPALGDRPRYTTMPFGEGELPIFIDDLGDGEYLARIDLDRDGDLSADPVKRCRHEERCGPFEVATGRAETSRQGLMLRYFTFQVQGKEKPVLWCSRAEALAGEVLGRPMAVVDDDTDGRFDGAKDLVLIDLDGDGVPTGAGERFLHHSPLFLGDRVLRITEVSAAGELQLTDAENGIFFGRALDVQTGKPVGGARIRLRPGNAETTSDGNGYFALEVASGRYDSVAVSATGFWGQVVQGQELADHHASPDATEPLKVLLETGPCPGSGRWCGRETLSASSVVNSHLDLETGIVGPRPGPRPERQDVAWSSSGGLELRPMPGARLIHLGAVDFDAVSSQVVHNAAPGEERTFAGPECAKTGRRRVEDGVLRPGSVLAAVTAEGNFARIRVEKCGFELQLSWIVE